MLGRIKDMYDLVWNMKGIRSSLLADTQNRILKIGYLSFSVFNTIIVMSRYFLLS